MRMEPSRYGRCRWWRRYSAGRDWFSNVNYAFFIAGTTLEMTIDPEKYMGRLVDYCMLKINAIVTVKETGQTWTGEDNLILEKPKLNIEVNQTQLN